MDTSVIFERNICKSHHVLVIPSLLEGMPLGLFEAMLCGCDCFCFKSSDDELLSGLFCFRLTEYAMPSVSTK